MHQTDAYFQIAEISSSSLSNEYPSYFNMQFSLHQFLEVNRHFQIMIDD